MSKARGLADLGNVYNDGALSNRNLIINGAMQVAQRGVSNGPNQLDGCLSLDRWSVNSSGGTKTISQEEFTVGQTDVPDFPKYYMRFAVSAGDNNLGVHQSVEDVTVLGGKTVTLSFWAKGTNPASGSFVSSWIQFFGSAGSASVETEAKSGIVLTSSWQKFTITFDVPSISGKTVGASSYTWVEVLRQPATDTGTSAWTADICQVQLEVGDTSTPFEHRSFDQENTLCQRYFQRYGAGATDGRIGVGGWNNSTSADMLISLTHEMRVTPTVSAPSKGRVLDFAVAWYPITSFITGESTTKTVNIGATISGTSGAAQGDIAFLGGGGGAYDYQMDAEL